jgi:SAM-dependent methyltransferase
MLQAYTGAAYQPWLRGSLEGIAPQDIDGILRGARLRRRRGRLVHVRLAAAAAKRASERSEDVETEAKRARFSGRVLDNTWRNLERLVRRLEWAQARSTWSAYGTRDHYAEPELAAKDAFVRAVAGARPRQLVYDLGANDGRFARIAAEHAPHVIAADADVLVVDRLYRTLRAERDERIQPLALDLADPSPGLGFGGGERPSFAKRGRPDLVLYLAVVHHLAITRTVPLALQLDELAALGGEVVFELPTEDDPKVRTLLLAKRRGLFDDYRADVAERLVGERFDVARRETLASGTRILYHLVPRS